MRTLPLVLAAVLLSADVSASERDKGFRLGVIAAAAVAGADIATTAQAAERGGYTEANPVLRPLFREPVLLGLVNGALTGVVVFGADRLRETRPTLAKGFLWAWTGLRALVVFHNVQQLRKGKR